MTSEPHDPWAGIEKAESGFNRIRINPDHPHDFYWAKDENGAKLLLLLVNRELAEFLTHKAIDLKGVKADIRHNYPKEEFFFLLTLQKSEDSDIFYRLCIDLIDHTSTVSEPGTALEVILIRLKRWKTFLSRKRANLLTEHEIQGLFSELEFLRDLLSKEENQRVILEGWKGPQGGPHDFVLGDYAVEVKSTSKSAVDTIKISSENQLLTHLDRLFLHVYSLAVFHDCNQGISLNSMVEKVRDSLDTPEIIDLFDSRILETCYMELKEYDQPCFSFTGSNTYEVLEDFPRITPDILADGLSNVTYDLKLGSLKKFKCIFPDDWRDK